MCFARYICFSLWLWRFDLSFNLIYVKSHCPCYFGTIGDLVGLWWVICILAGSRLRTGVVLCSQRYSSIVSGRLGLGQFVQRITEVVGGN